MHPPQNKYVEISIISQECQLVTPLSKVSLNCLAQSSFKLVELSVSSLITDLCILKNVSILEICLLGKSTCFYIMVLTFFVICIKKIIKIMLKNKRDQHIIYHCFRLLLSKASFNSYLLWSIVVFLHQSRSNVNISDFNFSNRTSCIHLAGFGSSINFVFVSFFLSFQCSAWWCSTRQQRKSWHQSNRLQSLCVSRPLYLCRSGMIHKLIMFKLFVIKWNCAKFCIMIVWLRVYESERDWFVDTTSLLHEDVRQML